MATGDHALTALLAEYSALRAEIDRRSRAQATLTNLALTFTGALAAYAFAKDLLFVLLLQPVLCCALGLLYADHGALINSIARYTIERLAPRVSAIAGEPDLLGWESVGVPRAIAWRPFWLLPPIVVFLASSISVLVLTFRRTWLRVPHAHGLVAPWPWATRYLWVFGVWLVALCAAGFYVAFFRHRVWSADEALDS